jgi:transcription initiation factor IIE alpha subunit
LRIYYQSQELSQKIGESIKKIIKEELEKKNHDLNRVGYAALCSSAPYILEDACNYAKNTLVL